MDEEGLQSTDNELIHIGKPIDFDEELFTHQLEELDELSRMDSPKIKAKSDGSGSNLSYEREWKRGVTMAHIYLASPHMSEEGYEQQYVKEAFDTNWIAPLGKNVNEFEKELAAYVGAKDAAALSAGSAALHLALKAAGVKAGDIVFCQDLTFSATANPIAYEKAIPVFIDSDYETWNMSPEALERAFEKYPDVKAVMPVHLYGLPANMDRIMEICKKHGVPVIEDAAESLGTLYHGQYTGTFGDYGAFSFNGNKIITTSGGGMLVCNLPEEQAKERIAKVSLLGNTGKRESPPL